MDIPRKENNPILLRARVAELEADAKRYRALRDSGKYGVAVFGQGWCLGGGDSPDELDAAADELIKRSR